MLGRSRRRVRILGADDEIRAVRPVLEERIAADRARRDGRPRSVAANRRRRFPARARRASPRPSAGRPRACRSSASSIEAAICGTPARMKTLPIRTPGAPELGLAISSAPSRHARHAQPRVGDPAGRRGNNPRGCARAAGWMTTPTPSAAAIESTVMSSWVGPMPPVVKQIIVRAAHRVDRLADAPRLVGHDAHLGEADALALSQVATCATLLVRGAARQDFVADHDQRRGPDCLVWSFSEHSGSTSAPLGLAATYLGAHDRIYHRLRRRPGRGPQRRHQAARARRLCRHAPRRPPRRRNPRRARARTSCPASPPASSTISSTA